jgi:hypothetical protein
VVEGAKGLGVSQGSEQIGSVITLTQREDVAGVMGRRAVFLGFKTAKKTLGLRAQLLEGFA